MRKIFTCLCFLFAGVSQVQADNMSPFLVIRNQYSSNPVTTSAWVQIYASLPNATRAISVFDSSGQIMVLGVGAAGSEVPQTWYIFPGGTDLVPVYLPSSARISLEAISGTASAGEIDINLYQ